MTSNETFFFSFCRVGMRVHRFFLATLALFCGSALSLVLLSPTAFARPDDEAADVVPGRMPARSSLNHKPAVSTRPSKASHKVSLSKLDLPMPAHLLFIPDVVKGGQPPFFLLSWQSSEKGGRGRIVARVLQQGKVVGRRYSFSPSSKSRVSTRNARRGLLGTLPVDVHSTSDGERGRVFTFAKMGDWQTVDSARRQTIDEPVVVESSTLRLWVKGAISLEGGRPVVVDASLHGTRTSVKGKVIAAAAVENDGVFLLDERGNPIAATSSLGKSAFFVDTASACGMVVPRAMVLPWNDAGAAMKDDGLQYLRLLSTQIIACDDVTAVIRMKGRYIAAGNEVNVRGVWLQHLPRRFP